MENATIKFLPGTWEGFYRDVKGHNGQLNLKLQAEGANVGGEFVLNINPETVTAYTIRGKVDGKIKENRLTLKVSVPGLKEPIIYKAVISDAGSFARQGLYGNADSPDPKYFGGGVWMAWNYETQK